MAVTITAPLFSSLKKLAAQAVATTQTTLAHGLARTPTIVLVTPKSNAVVWESAASDATNIYLTASVAATVDVFVS